jgi:DNA-directed RNA polymerase specialized sigma24 family protein
VEVMGRYSNPDNATRLRRVLSGHGRDRPSRRPVPSVREKQTRLTDSQHSEVVRRYAAGESSNALAAEFGVRRRTATAIIRRAGAEVRYRADVDLDAAGELYQSGLSLARVGAELDVSAGTVLNLLRRAGIATRRVGTNQWREQTATPPAR